MPADARGGSGSPTRTTRVFDFVNTIKDYVRNELSHESWIVKRILIPLSKKYRITPYGYKVVPLEVNIIAYDKDSKQDTKCRIQYEQICELFSNGEHAIPYLSVNQSKKDTRKIYPEGTTILDIQCAKVQSFNGAKYYEHKTYQDNIERLVTLNDNIMDKINERIEIYKQSCKEDMDAMTHQLLEDE